MKDVSLHVGKRIRLYRKTKNLTIEVFAGMINKSKATISKYENGDISIDIETLFLIANALDISINQLVDYEIPTSVQAGEEGAASKRMDRQRLYLYFYDGRRNRFVKNVIEMHGDGQNGVYDATLYAYLEDYSNLYKCKFLYHGTMNRYDSFTIFSFVNQNNKVERVFLYAINSFTHNSSMMGMFSGLSTQPILPASFKCVLSPNVMEENEVLKDMLVFSKDDIKNIKKMNMFVVTPNF